VLGDFRFGGVVVDLADIGGFLVAGIGNPFIIADVDDDGEEGRGEPTIVEPFGLREKPWGEGDVVIADEMDFLFPGSCL
jgi:hypothetical protein